MLHLMLASYLVITLVQIQLSINGLGKAAGYGLIVWVPATQLESGDEAQI